MFVLIKVGNVGGLVDNQNINKPKEKSKWQLTFYPCKSTDGLCAVIYSKITKQVRHIPCECCYYGIIIQVQIHAK